MSTPLIDRAPATAGAAAAAARPVRTVRADLARLDRALTELERAQRCIEEAERLRASDPRAAFELAHRGALRAAGVVIEQANRTRTRRLPLNVWAALSRCGAHHRAWSIEAAPMVAERARLDRASGARPDPVLLEAHCRRTRERIEGIRAEVTMSLLPEGAPQGASPAPAPRGGRAGGSRIRR